MPKHELEKKHLPQHIAIIMDGNRRWARQRHLSVTEGHRAGAQNLEKIVTYCQKIGIKYLTVYALSTENWRKRAKAEVRGIFNILIEAVRRKAQEYKKQGVKIFILGNIQDFPQRVRRALEKILNVVKEHERLKFNIALNYGGRAEIIQAVKRIIEDGVPPGKVNEALISRYLYTNGQPDPDLVIRTGGELRLSNFLLWQLSYAELYFTKTLWPDFSEKELKKAILDFQRRERRLGK